MTSKNQIRDAFGDESCLKRETIEAIRGSGPLYVVFLVARSGSTWLTELATNSAVLGTPHEWLNEVWIHGEEESLGCRPPRLMGTADVNEYVRRSVVRHRVAGGAMGIELSRPQSKWLCELLEDPQHAIASVTPFFLRRRNLVAQAISLHRSTKSGLYHSYQTDPELKRRFRELQYDRDGITHALQQLLQDELWFEQFFRQHGLEPHQFVYEQLLKDPSAVLSWMRKLILADSAGDRLEPESSLMRRMADAKSSDWEARFRTEAAESVRRAEAERAPFATTL